jgi:hypothetical protein
VKSYPLLILDQMARNLVMAVPAVSRWRSRRGRTASIAGEPSKEDLEVFAYGPLALVEKALGPSGTRNAVVVEIGPGDHIPVGLLSLAAGARRYIAVDRFAGDIGGPRARRFYAALGRDLEARRPDLAEHLKARGIDPEGFPDTAAEAVTVVHRSIEDAPEVREVDVVISNNTVEHVVDVESLGRASFAMLRAGGTAAHRVDFAAHDVWSIRPDPLEWLSVPDALWRRMGSHRGTPNRLRFHEVEAAFTRAGFQVEAQILECYERDLIREARPRLARRFRTMSEDSLAVRTAHIFCRKP